MNSKKSGRDNIIKAIGLIDDELISEYDKLEGERCSRPLYKNEYIKGILAMAACFVIIVALGAGLIYSHLDSCGTVGPNYKKDPDCTPPAPSENVECKMDVLTNAYCVQLSSVDDSLAWLSNSLSENEVTKINNLNNIFGQHNANGYVRPDDIKNDADICDHYDGTGNTAATTLPNKGDDSTENLIRKAMSDVAIPQAKYGGSNVAPSSMRIGLAVNTNASVMELIPYVRYDFPDRDISLKTGSGGETVNADIGVSIRFLTEEQKSAYRAGISQGRTALGYKNTEANASAEICGKNTEAYFASYTSNGASFGYLTFYMDDCECEIEISFSVKGNILDKEKILDYIDQISNEINIEMEGIQ